jgi:hypothetical protein
MFSNDDATLWGGAISLKKNLKNGYAKLTDVDGNDFAHLE